jgi:hypothetical protein
MWATPVLDEGKNGGRRGIVRDDRHGDDGGGDGGAVISLLIVRWVEGTADHEEKQKGRAAACAPQVRLEPAAPPASFPILFGTEAPPRASPNPRLCGFVRIEAGKPPVTDQNLSDQQSRGIASQIREELARRRMSRRGLADLAKISIPPWKRRYPAAARSHLPENDWSER